MRSKIHTLLFGLLFAVSSIAVPLLFSQDASADHQVQHNKSPEWLAKSYWYHNALMNCRYGALYFDKEEMVEAGEWWSINRFNISGSGKVYGYFPANDISNMEDGAMMCGADKDTLLKSALSFWGIEPIDLACDASPQPAERLNETSCKQGNGDFDNALGADETKAAIKEYLNTEIYGASPTQKIEMNGPTQYAFYKQTFLNSCVAGQSAHDTNPGGARVLEITNVVQNGDNYTTKPAYYVLDENYNADTDVRTYPSGGRVDCQTLAQLVRDNAGAYTVELERNADDYNDSEMTGQASDESQDSCRVEGIGWILCPVMLFVGKITDQSYRVVAAFLEVQPLSTSTNDPLYKAWSMVRNFANVAFVIGFLVIIFSQITSIGITNYGIKKLLPRIVIAAILVNVSYWICAVAVDISNILGYALSTMFNGPTQTVIDNSPGGIGSANTWDGGKAWVNVIGGILAGTLLTGALLYAGLSVLLPIVIAALCAIVALVVILVARQALLVLLIVLAPLAFVAYLLPNTESLFKRWLGLFQTLLLIFPIIALGYGVCKFAGALLMGAS